MARSGVLKINNVTIADPYYGNGYVYNLTYSSANLPIAVKITWSGFVHDYEEGQSNIIIDNTEKVITNPQYKDYTHIWFRYDQ